MSRSSKKKERDLLYDAILTLKDKEECKRFFKDLCTDRKSVVEGQSVG